MLLSPTQIFLEVARRVDGALLVRKAVEASPAFLATGGRLYVLAIGKVAFPMFKGLLAAAGSDRLTGGLMIAPQTLFPSDPCLPAGIVAMMSDHPDPTERSVAAGRAARDLLGSLSPSDRLVVLLSGGGSATLAVPADGLSLEEKRATTKAIARASASIAELNTVRKHLSAIKGGRLALATPAPIIVLALSDVVGNDPSVIASGPFSADATTFEQAVVLVEHLAPTAPSAARDHLRRGAAGHLGETPKPGDERLAHVQFEVLAGPERVPEEARQIVAAEGRTAGLLSRDTETRVQDLAAAYGSRAHRELAAGGVNRVLIGNGEPVIVVRGEGRGGRATHLALMVAREIQGLHHVSFLAAGTDDRDGSSDSSGAVVDGTTWARAEAAGLDPAGALERCDSEAPLKGLGCLVRGPATSNLLDLHLMAIGE